MDTSDGVIITSTSNWTNSFGRISALFCGRGEQILAKRDNFLSIFITERSSLSSSNPDNNGQRPSRESN